MTTSSDWIAAAVEPGRETSSPAWIAALGHGAGFNEGWIGTVSAPERNRDQRDGSETGGCDETMRAEALAQAYADGEAAGRAAALAETEVRGEDRRRLRATWRELDAAVLDTLADELRETVLALCEQTVGELSIDADALSARCIEAAKRFGAIGDQVKLHLHPEDIALLGENFVGPGELTPDHEIERGGLRLVSGDAAVHDGPAEWRRALREALRG